MFADESNCLLHYGSPDVLRPDEIEEPAAGDDEILIKVRVAAVNPDNFHS